MELTRVSKKYVEITVTAKLADGTPAALTGVDVAFLTPYAAPVADTVWTPAAFTDDVARVLLAGPDADPAGATVIPTDGADLWVRVTDSPEVDATRIERIVVR